jgi:amphi-Trp domain-containing protein
MASKKNRDIEKDYPRAAFVAKLRRLAAAIQKKRAFTISIAGQRLRVPATARFNVEHERGDGLEEIEFQVKWKS